MTISYPKCKFINHASVLIAFEKVQVLFDPWYESAVFNNSWRLLNEFEPDIDTLKNVTHICISHEHPDHFHLETLRKIKPIVSESAKLIFPARTNENVRKAVQSLGYDTLFIDRDGTEYELGRNVWVSYFGEESDHDNTIVLSSEGFVVVNQNDHYTSNENITKINQRYPKIEILLTQFSLAGFYGNKRDPAAIKKNGVEFHKNRLVKYAKAFKPNVTVPFASFVYFCHPQNSYLNDYIIEPNDIAKVLGRNNIPYQIPFFGDEIISDLQRRQYQSDLALRKLELLFDAQNYKIVSPEIVDVQTIKNIMEKTLAETGFLDWMFALAAYLKALGIKNGLQGLYRQSICLTDVGVTVEWRPFSKVVWIQTEEPGVEYDLWTSSDQLFGMLSFPWGPDTFNIAACFEEQKSKRWTILKHILMRKKASHYK